MLTHEQLIKLDEVLTQGCEKHLANGGTIIAGLYDNGSGGSCPLWSSIDTNIIKDKKGSHHNLVHFALIQAVGFPFKELDLNAFLAGFDGLNRRLDDDLEMYELGVEYRKTYLGTTLKKQDESQMDNSTTDDES